MTWSAWADGLAELTHTECHFWSEYVSTIYLWQCPPVLAAWAGLGPALQLGYLWGHTAVTITLSPLSRLSPIDKGRHGTRHSHFSSSPHCTSTSHMTLGITDIKHVLMYSLLSLNLKGQTLWWTFIGKLLIFHSCQLWGYLVGTTHSVTIHPTPARGWWCGGSLVWTGPGWCVLRLRPVSHAAPRHLAPTAAAQPTAACTDTAAHGDTSHIPSHLQLLWCPQILTPPVS